MPTYDEFLGRATVVLRHQWRTPHFDGRPGTLGNLTKQEFTTLLLHYMPQAEALTEDQNLVVDLADGRLLVYNYHVLGGGPPLREWSIHLYTLNQRTAKCLRRLHERQAWVYPAPFQGEGYKTDPSGKWRYSVWR